MRSQQSGRVNGPGNLCYDCSVKDHLRLVVINLKWAVSGLFFSSQGARTKEGQLNFIRTVALLNQSEKAI